MRDGFKQKLDFKLNKKIGKVFDISNILRIEVEFPIVADFNRMKTDFHNASISVLPVVARQQKTDLETCIKRYAKPETLEGQN